MADQYQDLRPREYLCCMSRQKEPSRRTEDGRVPISDFSTARRLRLATINLGISDDDGLRGIPKYKERITI